MPAIKREIASQPVFGEGIVFHTRFLYARIAKTYATSVIPMHHASATQMSLPTGCSDSNARMASTIEVTGWCSAKARTTDGIDSVGTNAELIKGRKISG